MAVPMYQAEKHTLHRDHAALDRDSRDTLFLLAGFSMMVFGAGLVMTNPAIRRYLGQASFGGVSNLVQTVLPDIERYLKLRSM